jgi:hypothetical protein
LVILNSFGDGKLAEPHMEYPCEDKVAARSLAALKLPEIDCLLSSSQMKILFIRTPSIKTLPIKTLPIKTPARENFFFYRVYFEDIGLSFF